MRRREPLTDAMVILAGLAFTIIVAIWIMVIRFAFGW